MQRFTSGGKASASATAADAASRADAGASDVAELSFSSVLLTVSSSPSVEVASWKL
eukprot:COSAG02_NODE_41987_length_389_cov_0.531034_1_plen_55_part_10